jgi:hypothetical protein
MTLDNLLLRSPHCTPVLRCVGGLADLMRGRVSLTERIEIVVADIHDARSVIAEAWPCATITESGSGMRVLFPGTPLYVDVVAQSVATVEPLQIRGVVVCVAGANDELQDVWSRPGFTLRERLGALHALTRDLVPRHVLTGVRKYRAIEEANAERERWDTERVDRIRAERLRK